MPTQNINVGAGLVPEISLFGDWDKLTKAISQLPIAVAIGAQSGKIAAAEKIMSLIKKNIRRGGPAGTRWPEYSEKYKKRKAADGVNVDRKWHYHGTYYNNIKVITKGNSTFVGVPRNVRSRVNPKKPLTLGQIANILERGSAAHNIQARPLWNPTFKEFGGRARVKYHIVWHIRNSVYAMTGLRAKITL